MAAGTQVTTFSDLYTDLQNRVHVATGITATENIAKRFINIALHDMHIGNGEQFTWAHRQAYLRTKARYVTGTVTATVGSSTLTGASTLWDTNNDFSEKNAIAGGKLVIDGQESIYEVTTVGSDTDITMNTKWIDATEASLSYVYFEDEYALAADFLRPLDLQYFDSRQEVQIIGLREFRRRYPRPDTTGKPLVATIIDKPFSGNTTPVRKAKFWMPPDLAYLLPYDYVTSSLAVSSAGAAQTQLTGDTDEPIVPLIYRHAIVFHGLYHWYRDQKNDTRATTAKAEYEQLLLRIAGDREVGASRPQLAPRLGGYRRSAKRPYSRGKGKYTTGSSFDEIRS